MENNNEAYTRLAAGIIEQAVKDYKKALIKLCHEEAVNENWQLKKPFEDCLLRVQNAWRIKSDCERFFLSDWFVDLYSYVLDAETYTGLEVMRKLREDVANGKRKTTRSNPLA